MKMIFVTFVFTTLLLSSCEAFSIKPMTDISVVKETETPTESPIFDTQTPIEPEPSPTNVSYVTVGVVWVRSEPSPKAQRMTLLDRGVTVSTQGCSGDWCQLDSGGWVFAGCLGLYGLGCEEAK